MAKSILNLWTCRKKSNPFVYKLFMIDWGAGWKVQQKIIVMNRHKSEMILSDGSRKKTVWYKNNKKEYSIEFKPHPHALIWALLCTSVVQHSISERYKIQNKCKYLRRDTCMMCTFERFYWIVLWKFIFGLGFVL